MPNASVVAIVPHDTIGAMSTQAHFRFVHLTDTHIMAGGSWKSRAGDFEFDTEASLRRVVEAVRALDPAPAFAVVGGDLASPDILDRARVLTPAEYEPSYRLLAETLAGLPCPVRLLIGNHDNRVAFNRVFRADAPAPDASHYYSFEHQGVPFRRARLAGARSARRRSRRPAAPVAPGRSATPS